MSRSLRLLATSLPLFLASGGALCAQTGQIVGVVVSAGDSSRLSGVEVRVTGTNAHALTGTDGAFVLIGLAPGVYEITARRIGYASQNLQNVHIQSSVSHRVRIVLAPT